MAGLSPKQAMFVMEYLIDLNATQAAIRAGYAPRSASTEGARLLANDKVQAYIDDLMDARAHRMLISQDKVVRELARVALFDPHQVYDEEGRLRPIRDMPADIRAAISSIKHLSDGSIEVKFWDKNSAIDKLMKHMGLFEKDNRQITGGQKSVKVRFVKSGQDEPSDDE